MKEEIENYEENGKPLWNKSAIWDKIEAEIVTTPSETVLFPWLKFAAACGILLLGIWWIVGNENSSSFTNSSLVNVEPSTKTIVKKDTIYLTQTQTIENNVIVNRTSRIIDTVFGPQQYFTVYDTVLLTKEIYIASAPIIDTAANRSSKIPKTTQLEFAFNEPIGNYTPKTITSFKIFNKEPLPKGNNVKQTFIVLK